MVRRINRILPELRDRILQMKKAGVKLSQISRYTNVSERGIETLLRATDLGFDNVTDLLNYEAKRRGFRSHSDFQLATHFSKNPNCYRRGQVNTLQGEFEMSILDGLDERYLDRRSLPEMVKIRDCINSVFDELKKNNPRLYLWTIEYLNGKNFSEIAREFNLTRQNAHYEVMNKAIPFIQRRYKQLFD